jgi:hypothetical protein
MSTEEIPSVLDREFLLGIPATLACRSLLPSLGYPPDEAFAAKYMPDLGHDVKEFQVFHWKLSGWKKLEKKLTSSEFDCGGHKWYVLPGCCCLSHLRNPKTHSGAYFSSHSAIFPLQMTTSLYILIV